MNIHNFYCIDCKQDKQHESNFATGYAQTNDGPVCYACMAYRDRKDMVETGKAILYLVSHYVDDNHNKISNKHVSLLKSYGKNVFKRYFISNWPGTLLLPCHSWRESKTNWGCKRIDAWFKFGGRIWWSRQQGDNEIARCKATKEKHAYYTPSWLSK